MVEVSITGDRVRFDVLGVDAILGVKRRIEVPARKIVAVERQTAPLTRWAGVRMGTGIPGVLRIGSFWWGGAWTYWDVRFQHPERIVAVDLRDAHYSRLIIEVPDPDAAIALIESALD